MNPALRRLIRILLWIAGIWAALIILIEIVLSSSFMTETVQRIATEHIDGDLDFERISLSMFRKFPDATLTLDDFSLTYPPKDSTASKRRGRKGICFTAAAEAMRILWHLSGISLQV